MSKWRVVFERKIKIYYDVEAENREDAIEETAFINERMARVVVSPSFVDSVYPVNDEE